MRFSITARPKSECQIQIHSRGHFSNLVLRIGGPLIPTRKPMKRDANVGIGPPANLLIPVPLFYLKFLKGDSPRADRRNFKQAGTGNLVCRCVPGTLTFVNEPTVAWYECQSRDPSGPS